MHNTTLFAICADNSYSGADSIGHGGHVPPLLQMPGHRGTVSRRTQTENWQTYSDHHECAHKNDYLYVQSQNSGGRTPSPPKKNNPALLAGRVPPPSPRRWRGVQVRTLTWRIPIQTHPFFSNRNYSLHWDIVYSDNFKKNQYLWLTMINYAHDFKLCCISCYVLISLAIERVTTTSESNMNTCA